MNHRPTLLAAAIALLGSSSTPAYELATHGWITARAQERSVLAANNAQSILPVLGFNRLDAAQPFAAPYEAAAAVNGYYDNPPAPAEPFPVQQARFAEAMDRRVIADLIEVGQLGNGASLESVEHSIAGWLVRGAVREDDNGLRQLGIDLHFGQRRKRDPYGEVMRAMGHFYNPLDANGALDVPQCNLDNPCTASIEWSLGRSFGALTDPGDQAGSPPLTTRRNHFTWVDARNNYYWALTQRRDADNDGYDAADRRRSAQERLWRWASTVTMVGHVIHLLQDTGQPQHTRNDGHAPPFLQMLQPNEEASDASYEAYTDGRLLNQRGNLNPFTNPLLYMDEGRPSRADGQLPPLVAGNYPVPKFTHAVRFFTTKSDDPASALQRMGLADYSNRGYFTLGTLPGTGGQVGYGLPDSPAEAPGDYTTMLSDTRLKLSGRTVWATDFLTDVRDVVQPGYDAASGVFTSTNNKVPLLRSGIFARALDLVPTTPEVLNATYVLHYQNLRAHADALLPRAIAYSAGLIDYFFRGKLDVEVPNMTLIAVMNQGETHSVDADGYPRRPDQSIFGFTKVRLKVRNATAEIVESGTATHSVQNASAGQLVAVARYHRNACYKPDLSGQRVQGFAAVPPAPITAPTCTPLLPERTDYEEISVSAPLAITGGDALPGMVGTTAPSWADKVFDFSADPIPVNATDLFIQVVYRGQLGDEPDGIAVGRLDVREPTFVVAYNGSDHRWTGSVWMPGSIGTTTRAADFFHLCGGSPTQLLYRNAVAPALRYAAGASPPEAVRLAVITTAPLAPSSNRVFRAQPTMIPSPSAEYRIFTSKGAIRQAGREAISASTAATDCTSDPVTGADAWCNTPSQRRRGQILGDAQQAIYYAPIGSNAFIDVDAAGLPAYASISVRSDGENRFNDETLTICPAPPAKSLLLEDLVKLQEQAAAEGIDWR